MPDPLVLISGGSRGLGLAMVAHCLERGGPVATFARQRTPELDALAARHAARFSFEALDSTDSEAVERFVERSERAFGPIHGLVNNAAVGQDHLLAHMSPADIAKIVAVNLAAPILLTRAVLKRMMLHPAGGRIVNITSICGSHGYAGLTVYSATKGGMDAFTRSLAREVGGRNILVNAIAPGFFASEMSAPLAGDQLEAVRRRTATGRLSTPADILPLLDLLLFGNTNMTGQVMAVDGGSG